MSTENLKELRNALSCWQDDYDRDDDKEQYDMFGAAIDAVSRLEAAKRERDELRAEQAEHDEQIARMEGKVSLAKRALDSKTARCEKAEAELRRRDAAAGEPVAVLYRNGDVLTKAECGEYFEICCKVETPLYTTAPPAVLPPEMNPEPEKYDVIDHGFIAGYNQCRADSLALGAQQQKVVELDNVFSVNVAGVAVRVVLLKDVSTSLDAANVKYEVKP